MEMTVDFSDVSSFGGISADVDYLLRECFREHPAYVSARAGKIFVVTGRKGSGKTAIYQKLILEKAPNYFSIGHTFEDYPWQHHDLQAQTGVPEESRYVHSWKYLILMTLSKILLNQDQSQPWSEECYDALVQLENFVVDSYGTRDPDVTQLFSPEKELRFKAGLNFGVGNFQGERVRVRELPLHVQEVNSGMQRHVISTLNPASEYFVCFDQLDLGFTVSDPKYRARLIGLILAARDLKRAAVAAGARLNVVIFLRDDIYRLLHFEDKNKITQTNLATVSWRERGDEAVTLKGLMERRFGQVLSGGGAVSWSDVFDETREMPGHQTKYVHICDRTFLRPRDMIQFCNEVLAIRKAGGDSAGVAFENSDVAEARRRYSDYLLEELDDEIAKHVPRYKEYLEVVIAVGRETFTRAQFHDVWSKRPSLVDTDANVALQELYDFSVIGYLKAGGGGGGSKWVWRYRDARALLASVPADAETLRVHPGFKEALDLVRGGAVAE